MCATLKRITYRDCNAWKIMQSVDYHSILIKDDLFSALYLNSFLVNGTCNCKLKIFSWEE